MNQDNFQAFSVAYTAGLLAAVLEKPEAYAIAISAGENQAQYAARVSAKMLLSIADGRAFALSFDGKGFKNACKTLGIKHTRRAIFAYLGIS